MKFKGNFEKLLRKLNRTCKKTTIRKNMKSEICFVINDFTKYLTRHVKRHLNGDLEIKIITFKNARNIFIGTLTTSKMQKIMTFKVTKNSFEILDTYNNNILVKVLTDIITTSFYYSKLMFLFESDIPSFKICRKLNSIQNQYDFRNFIFGIDENNDLYVEIEMVCNDCTDIHKERYYLTMSDINASKDTRYFLNTPKLIMRMVTSI